MVFGTSGIDIQLQFTHLQHRETEQLMVSSHWLLFLLLHEWCSNSSYCKVMLDIVYCEFDVDLCDILEVGCTAIFR